MRLFRFAILLAVLAAVATPVSAATVCCTCRPANDTGAHCLTMNSSKLANPEDCTELPQLSKSISGWSCDKTPLTESRCQQQPAGACAAEPLDAYAAGGSETVSSPGGTGNSKVEPGLIPELNVNIPNFAFLDSDVTETESWLLAAYINGAFRYAISISAVAATIMFTYGAFLYLVSSTLTSISNGKQIMMDAVLGLLLVLGSHLILRTINEDTLKLSALNIVPVPPGAFYAQRQIASNVINLETCTPNRGAPIPAVPASCPRGNVTSEMRTQATMVQEETGIPAFLLLGIYGNETGFSEKSCPFNNCGGIKCTTAPERRDWIPIGQTMDCGENCALLKTKEDFHDGKGQVPVMACFKKFPNDTSGLKYKKRFDHIASVLRQKNFDRATFSWRDYQGNPDCTALYIQKAGWATAANYAETMKKIFRDNCLTP